MSQDQDGISLTVPSLGEGQCQERVGGGASGGAVEDPEETAGGSVPAAGSFWQDPSATSTGGGGGGTGPGLCPLETGGLLTAGRSGNKRPVTVAYVVNSEANLQNSAEVLALQCLRDACEAVGSKLDSVNFGKLDFGETTELDRFYNAGG
ncbi:unnamed protein product [Knipowitschia caucasica]